MTRLALCALAVLAVALPGCGDSAPGHHGHPLPCRFPALCAAQR